MMCYVCSGDLTFDAVGYTFITINNVYTAASGVYTKKLLEAKVTISSLVSHFIGKNHKIIEYFWL